jgi:hypothetical protein
MIRSQRFPLIADWWGAAILTQTPTKQASASQQGTQPSGICIHARLLCIPEVLPHSFALSVLPNRTGCHLRAYTAADLTSHQMCVRLTSSMLPEGAVECRSDPVADGAGQSARPVSLYGFLAQASIQESHGCRHQPDTRAGRRQCTLAADEELAQ